MRYRNGWVADSYISAHNLSKVYTSGGADLVVFSGLNLEVERGEMLALVGESGAGKSTLLHLLGGLDRPSKGTIYYGRTEISRLADSEQADFRNREIGFVWQIHYLLPEFTALENVMMPLLIRGVAACQGRRRNRWRGWMKWGFARARRIARVNYRAANSSGWCWPGRWWASPPSCWPTSLPETWTSGPAR